MIAVATVQVTHGVLRFDGRQALWAGHGWENKGCRIRFCAAGRLSVDSLIICGWYSTPTTYVPNDYAIAIHLRSFDQ